MKKRDQLLLGLSVLAITLPTMAQNNAVVIKQEITKVEKSPFSGAFDISVGSDNNALVSKGIEASGSFYQISPSLKYTNGIFTSNISASIKDFNDQQISNNAKETSASIKLGIGTEIFGSTKSDTNLGLSYSDSRWPDFFGDDQLTGPGMPVRYSEAKLSQRLGFNLDRMTLSAGGSFANRNYTSRYSDWAKDIFGAREFQNDQTIAAADLNVDVKLTDMISIAAIPSLSQKKFDERPARETDGSKAGLVGNAPMTEFLNNDLRAEIRINTGRFSATPFVMTGVQMDQATGGEDLTRSGGGLELSLTLKESLNLKLSAAINIVKSAYDNWTYNMLPGNFKREDNDSTSDVNLSMDLNKSVGIGLAYSNIEEESTLNDSDENYRQEIVMTNLSIRF
jgi:hypothetical protein